MKDIISNIATIQIIMYIILGLLYVTHDHNDEYFYKKIGAIYIIGALLEYYQKEKLGDHEEPYISN